MPSREQKLAELYVRFLRRVHFEPRLRPYLKRLANLMNGFDVQPETFNRARRKLELGGYDGGRKR